METRPGQRDRKSIQQSGREGSTSLPGVECQEKKTRRNYTQALTCKCHEGSHQCKELNPETKGGSHPSLFSEITKFNDEITHGEKIEREINK